MSRLPASCINPDRNPNVFDLTLQALPHSRVPTFTPFSVLFSLALGWPFRGTKDIFSDRYCLKGYNFIFQYSSLSNYISKYILCRPRFCVFHILCSFQGICNYFCEKFGNVASSLLTACCFQVEVFQVQYSS